METFRTTSEYNHSQHVSNRNIQNMFGIAAFVTFLVQNHLQLVLNGMETLTTSLKYKNSQLVENGMEKVRTSFE